MAAGMQNWRQVVCIVGIVSALSLTAVGQGTKDSGGSEANVRRQAYLKFIDAQRLKGEAQRTQNARLLQEAIDAYQAAIKLDPTAADPHLDLGELYFFFQSRLDLAEREAREAIRLDPQVVGGHLLLARVSMTVLRFEKEPKPEQVDRALRAYEEVAKLDPGQTEAWAMLSDLYDTKNDSAKQLQALERWTGAPTPTDTAFYRWLMNKDLSSDRAYYELSQLYRQSARPAEALAAARRAYELDPDSPIYARNLIATMRQSAVIEEELRLYAHLAKVADSQALQIGYGAALVRAGRNEEAIARLANYVKSDPANASATVLLAIAQRRAGARQAAVETLKAGLSAVEPTVKTSLMLDLGETYEELGRNEEALAQYEQVFETFFGRGNLNGQRLDLFNHILTRMTRIYRRTGKEEKVETAFTRARPLIGDRSAMLDLLAIENLREDGKRREALELAQVTARRFPDDRSVKLTQALILSDLRRFKESSDLLRGMLSGKAENATEDASVYLLLSSVELQSGEVKSAEATIRKAIELNPDDVGMLIQLGSVEERAGQLAEAEKTLREILRREPDNATALNNLGYFLIEHGARFQEAFTLIERAVSIEPINGNFLDSLGWAHFKLGRFDQARTQLERAAQYSRRSPTLHEHLGDVLKGLGKLGDARKQWERALEFSVEAEEIARLKDKLKESQ
jgi:tetratricopeptide (TPR) repeat protein